MLDGVEWRCGLGEYVIVQLSIFGPGVPEGADHQPMSIVFTNGLRIARVLYLSTI